MRNADVIQRNARESKREWAWRNRDKVRECNRRYREWNREKTNRQAAARMQRMRLRKKHAQQGTTHFFA